MAREPGRNHQTNNNNKSEDGGRAQATREPLRDDQIETVPRTEMMGDFKETAGRTRKDTSELQNQGMTASSDSRPRLGAGDGPCVSVLRFPLKLCVASGTQKKAEPLRPHWEGAGGCSPDAPRLPRSAGRAGLPRAGGAGSAANTGRGTLFWSLPLTPRRDKPQASFAGQPRRCPSPPRLKLSPPGLPSLPPRARRSALHWLCC